MKIGFICTNYFSYKDSQKAVESLSQQITFENFIIVIVDNGSDEENETALLSLCQKYDNVEVLLNKKNVGYFAGLNIGIKFLRDKYDNIEVLVVGNNDLIFPNGFYKMMVENKDLLMSIPVISPDIITKDGEHQNPHVIKGISLFREVIYDLYYSSFFLAKLIIWFAKISKKFTSRTDGNSFHKAQFIHQGHGSCYILGPTFFHHFDELLNPSFLMYEELFLSYQLKTKNFQVYYEPSIKINHSWHSSINNIPKKKIWLIAKEAHKVSRKYFNPYTI